MAAHTTTLNYGFPLWCLVTSQYFLSQVQNAAEDFISAVHIHIDESTRSSFVIPPGCSVIARPCASSALSLPNIAQICVSWSARLCNMSGLDVNDDMSAEHPSFENLTCTLWYFLGTSSLPGLSDLWRLSQRVICIFDERSLQVSRSAPTHHAKVVCQPHRFFQTIMNMNNCDVSHQDLLDDVKIHSTSQNGMNATLF